ncbi:MAG: TSUP family transporter [Actinomycetota bacterium]|nr:TSUP family transporter [Actinomycetota bacterium]
MTTAVLAVAVAVGALAQAVSGIGFALVCGPFLVAVLGPQRGVPVAVVLSLPLNAAILLRDPRSVRWRAALLLLVPAAAVLPLAAYAVHRLSGPAATVVAGAATLCAAAALAAGLRLHRARGPAGAVAAGVVSGAMNVVAGIGGPAAALFAANAEWPPATTRATLQAHFLALNVVTLAVLGLPSVSPGLFGAVLAGFAAGTVLAGRLPEAAARWATLALAAASGVAAVVRGLL